MTRALLSVPLLLAGLAARADTPEGEFRLYLDTTATSVPVLQPFARGESRLHTEGLVYEKLSAGVRAKATGWLKVSAYLAHCEKITKDARDELIVGNLLAHERLGAWELRLRAGNEWHTAGFYRYRQLHELRWHLGEDVALWANDEVRFDTDEGRVTMNNARLGLDLAVEKSRAHLSPRLDVESTRRGADAWSSVIVLGLVVKAGV